LELLEYAGTVYRCTVIASKVAGRRNKRSSNIEEKGIYEENS
jgi:hypothetical protein